MKKLYRFGLAICSLVMLLLQACSATHTTGTSGSTSPVGPLYRVTSDYVATASSDASGIHPIVRDDHTVIELREDRQPLKNVTDDQGQVVAFTKDGNSYVMDRLLSDFTMSANGSGSARFLLMQLPAPPENIESLPDIVTETPAAIPAVDNSVADRPAISAADSNRLNKPVFLLMRKQLDEQRLLLNREAQSLKRSQAEQDDVMSKISQLESKMAQDTAVVNVHFGSGKSVFRPSQVFSEILLDAAHQAGTINLYGRTDSRMATRGNERVAFRRVMAVKRYLVRHGISEDKISISWLAAGDFVAPSTNARGKALNRRVAIELIPYAKVG